MRGSEDTSRIGHIAALATLVVSAALFAIALFGIASIDTGAATPAQPAAPPPGRTVSLLPARPHDGCPGHNSAAPRSRGVDSVSGV
jgi:hypothetical protein